MANSRIEIENLSDVLTEALETYAAQTAETTKRIAKEVSAEAKERVSETSPRSKGMHSGTYAAGWQVSKRYENAETVRYSIHHKKPGYRLTHLLEKGHAARNGKRVAAIPHIKPGEEWAVQEVVKRIKDEL